MPKKRLWYSYSHGAMGILILTNVANHHAWTPIVLLMSARNLLMTLGSWWEFLIHAERKRSKQAVWGKEILTFSFVHPVGLPHSIHLPASEIPAFPPCSGFKGCGQSLGVCSQKCQCARCCI